MIPARLARFLVGPCILVLSLIEAVSAQDTTRIWNNQAELGVVWTGGNASSTTLGIKNTLTGEFGASSFNLEAGGIRTKSSITTRVANGTATQFTVMETTVSQTTAESYFARSKYTYSVTNRAYWFGGADWDRNTFSGVSSRFAIVTGAGVFFSESDATRLRADLGITYTIQKNVAMQPTSRFAGLRFTLDLTRVATETATFDSKLTLDENLSDPDDLRIDLVNSVSVSMSERMALKTGLRLLFDNQPSFLDVPLVTGGNPTGSTVPAQLQNVDAVFTVTLVINIA